MSVGLRLRVDNYDLMMRAIGMDSDAAIAALIGMHPKTIGRARQGIIGVDFIVNNLAALRKRQRLLSLCGLEPTFDNVFEIVECGVLVA